MADANNRPEDRTDATIIHVEDDQDGPIEHHVDDWLAFILFWGMAIVTFLQFFSRYVLNDSFAWTEEIDRYLLMWLTFIGSAVVFRRRTNIAVDILPYMLPEKAARILRAISDCITLAFVGVLLVLSWTVMEKMKIQRMTVFDISMSVVYGGIAFGCLLMFWRATTSFLANARRGWREDENSTPLIID
jgi:TRAP-type transport system small permease protein